MCSILRAHFAKGGTRKRPHNGTNTCRIGAALSIFTFSMEEIAVSFFLIGRDNTLPLEIWGRLRRGITPEINAISTIIFVSSLIAILFWYRLRTRAEVAPEIGAGLVETAGYG